MDLRSSGVWNAYCSGLSSPVLMYVKYVDDLIFSGLFRRKRDLGSRLDMVVDVM